MTNKPCEEKLKKYTKGNTNDLARKAALSFTLNGSLNEREMSVSSFVNIIPSFVS